MLRLTALAASLLAAALVLCSGCEKTYVVKIGEAPPPISATDIDGKTVDLAQLKGKTVLVYFWTNSCCATNVQELEPLYRKYRGQGLTILAVNELDGKDVVQRMRASKGLSFPLLMDERSVLLKRYQVYAFPTLYLVDGGGILRKKILGGVPVAKLEEVVRWQLEMQQKAEQSYEKLHVR